MPVEASGYMLGPPFSTLDDIRCRFEWKGCSIQEYMTTESGCNNFLVRTISREVAWATPQRLHAGHPSNSGMMIESELMGDHQPFLQDEAGRRRDLK